MCGYTETWSVPSNDAASIAFYLEMFGHYLFNISNTSLWQIGIEADSTEAFLTRAEPQDDSKTWPEGPRAAHNEGRASGAVRVPYDIPFPLPASIAWRNEFDLAALFADRLVNYPLDPKLSQDYYNVLDCGLEQRDEAAVEEEAEAAAEAGQAPVIQPNPSVLIRLNLRFLMETEEGKQACLTLTTQNAMRFLLAPFGMTPCGDRSYICRSELFYDPAPSPPPPGNWEVPPSPPAYAYEVLTLTTATGGTALFFLLGCVCCVYIGGHAARGRHTSRMWGRMEERVDRMPYARQDYVERGQELTGPFRPDLRQPAQRLNTGFSFGGMNLGYSTVRQ